MLSLFRNTSYFINNMDAKAMTSLMISLLMASFIFLMMLYGEQWLGIDQERLRQMMSQIAESPFALLGVVSVYCLMAMTGFPQALLMAGTIAVFGFQLGAMYAFMATMASASLTFALGNAFGGSLVRRMSSVRVARLIEKLQHHGIASSMLIRWTPSMPFIVVNAIAGAAHISIVKFWIGTALGIIPKIALIAIFIDHVDEIVTFFTSRDPQSLAMIGSILILWIAFLVSAHKVCQRLR